MSDLKERFLAALAKYERESAKLGLQGVVDGGPLLEDDPTDSTNKAHEELTTVENEIIELAQLAGFIVSEPLLRDRFGSLEEQQKAAA